MGWYSTFLRKTFLPGILARDQRQSALRHWDFFMKSQYWSQAEIADYQWQQLQQLLRHAYTTCPYYTRVFDERGLRPDSFHGPADLAQLPVLTRELVFEQKENLFSHDYPRDSLHRNTTGGTTGQAAELFIDQESYNLKQAAAWRNETWMGRYPCDKSASLWPAHMDLTLRRSWKSQLKERYFLREILYHTGYSQHDLLLGNYRHLMSFGPRYFKAFPSALGVFNDFLLAHDLPAPRLGGIMSTGEVLYPRQREEFSRVYQCPVFDMYGTRESGNIASECTEHQGRHISAETVLIEIAENGVPVPPGQEGEILVTDLTNRAFPLIRYQINDRGALLAEKCACGRALPLMSPAVGRLQDDIWLPDGSRQSGLMLAVHLTSNPDHMVGRIQVVQRSLTDFLLRITDKPVPTEETFAYLRGQLAKMFGDQIQVEIEVVTEIPQENSGKTRFIICKCEPPR